MSSSPNCLTISNILKVGAAYLAGARFDIALGELAKGNFLPKNAAGGAASQSVVPHAEL